MHEDFPKNEVEFDRRFRHEQACLDYLFQLRWHALIIFSSFAGQRVLFARTVATRSIGKVLEDFTCAGSAKGNNR